MSQSLEVTTKNEIRSGKAPAPPSPPSADRPDPSEESNRDPDEIREHGIVADLIRPAFVEFASTALFLFFTVGNVVFNAGDPESATFGVDGAFLSVESIAFSFGFMIFVLVYGTAHLSGAHINPAVTCALAATRRISLTKAALYVFAQCSGACVGCGLVVFCTPSSWLLDDKLRIGYNAVASPFNDGGAFVAEMIGTSLLMFTVMAAIDSNQQKNAEHIKNMAPLSIGVAVFLAHLLLVPVTGCSINPARSFGAAVAAGEWDSMWIFWLAPILGAVGTAFTYDLVLDERPNGVNCQAYMKGPKGW